MKKTKSTPQRKTTLKWNVNGELSSIDMARILISVCGGRQFLLSEEKFQLIKSEP